MQTIKYFQQVTVTTIRMKINFQQFRSKLEIHSCQIQTQNENEGETARGRRREKREKEKDAIRASLAPRVGAKGIAQSCPC